jgi:DNA primase
MTLIDEVKSRTDIVDVVANYVDLDTSSRNPKARCPFHTERTPSFYVFPETGTWRCFGACATGGDAISFVMKREGFEFKEALHILADRAGVQYGAGTSTVQADAAPKATVIEANDAAARWFSQMLLSSEGKQAREYLESRGIDMEVAERRGFGYAPGDGTLTLAGHMRSSSVTAQAARDAKLVVQGDDKAWRDFFRNRLMIQIRDRSGKIIGFGARSLDGSEPKYLNTPQTSAFDKSRTLYGLNWAADSMRQSRRAVVVEGYMDVITAHEYGFTDTIASMGTAVTPDQLNTLAQIVSGGGQSGEVVLCLDADAAGQDATLRALETAWQQFGAKLTGSRDRDIRVRVANPVGGKDPDEAIRADSWAWRKSLDEASPLIDFIMHAYVSRFDVTSGDGKSRVVDAISPLIFAVANDYDRDAYWEQLAGLLNVSPERLRSMASKPASRTTRARTASNPRGRRSGGEEISREQMGAVLSGVVTGIEEHVLALILQRPELREFAEAIPAEHFLDTANRELFTTWVRTSTLDEMLAALSEDLAESAMNLSAAVVPPSDHATRVSAITQCARRLRERAMRNLLKLTEIALKDEEGSMEGEEREELRNKTLDPSVHLRKVFEAGATGRI